MGKESATEKTKTITFRIDKNVLERIKSHAAFEKITLNALVNHLLAHAVDWDIVAAKSRWIPIPKTILMAWFDKLDEKTILGISENKGKNVSRDMLYTMRGKYDVRQLISVLRERAKTAGFSFTQIDDKNEVMFIMRHDMGLKWSEHFKAFYEATFKDLGCNVKFDLTENTIVYRLDRKYASNENE